MRSAHNFSQHALVNGSGKDFDRHQASTITKVLAARQFLRQQRQRSELLRKIFTIGLLCGARRGGMTHDQRNGKLFLPAFVVMGRCHQPLHAALTGLAERLPNGGERR